MKVKVISKFNDRTADNKLREVGGVLDVEQKRAEHLEKLGFVERIKVVEKPKGGDPETISH